MSTFKRNAIFLCLAVIVGIYAFFIFKPGLPDPVYQGKRLSTWLKIFDYTFGAPSRAPTPEERKTTEAILDAGTNAIPLLLEMAQKRDGAIESRLIAVIKKLPFKPLHLRSSDDLNYAAWRALEQLVYKNSNAVPVLMAIYENDPVKRRCIVSIFAMAGPMADEAVPLLVTAVRGTNMDERERALYALTRIHTRPEIVVPLFIGLLNESSRLKYGAATGLGEYGNEAIAAKPALLEALKGDDQRLQQAVRQSLQRIDPHWSEVTNSAGK